MAKDLIYSNTEVYRYLIGMVKYENFYIITVSEHRILNYLNGKVMTSARVKSFITVRFNIKTSLHAA